MAQLVKNLPAMREAPVSEKSLVNVCSSLNVYYIMASSQISQLVKNPPVMLETPVQFLGWRRDGLSTPVFLGVPCGSGGKESACNVGDLGSIPGLGGSSGDRKSYSLQYSGLKKSMDCTVRGVAKSWT